MTSSALIQIICPIYISSAPSTPAICWSYPQVVLVGGGCNTPKVQQMIRDKFPTSDVLSSIPPEEVLAEGAARQVGCQLSL